MFINPSTSQPQGSGCDVQVAGCEVSESWQMGLYSPAGKGKAVWGSSSPCSWALPYASLPLLPSVWLQCFIYRNLQEPRLFISAAEPSSHCRHRHTRRQRSIVTISCCWKHEEQLNRLHGIQSPQVMLNLQFPMLNWCGNTQSCFHLHSEVLKLEWKGPGNSGSLVLWSFCPRPSAEGVPLQTSLGTTLRTQSKSNPARQTHLCIRGSVP